MARRHRPQPRDNRGRFTKTGMPIWFGLLLIGVVLAAVALKG
jgi:hypothetical protein